MNPIVWLMSVGLITAYIVSSILSSLDSNPGSVTDHNLLKRRTFRSPSEWPRMNGEFQNIFWMVQVSDIHISVYHDPARSSDLLNFCSQHLNVIDPEIVLITGDLTDAKDGTGFSTLQIKEEWKTYREVTSFCRDVTRAKWFDIRGNHDSFDVKGYDSNNNYFRSHSAMGFPIPEQFQESIGYHYKLHMPFGTYSFIGFDASLKPGPNRPFNFLGSLDDKEIQYIKGMATASEGSNHTVWFGHFPTSLIVHDPPVLRNIMSNGIAYLCGHLHTLGDFVPKMYSRQKTGTLELELGDWKFNRMFRIIAFDHDIMSFVDENLGHWPLVLVTNPKDSQFYSPEFEPVEMVKYSTHIRMLVFNPSPIESVTVKIDNKMIGEAKPVKSPLYALEWDPMDYDNGLHTMEISVEDEDGHRRIVSHSFSVDGTSAPFRFIPRLILMPHLFSALKILFVTIVFLYTLILTSLRQCGNIRPFYVYGLPIFGGMNNSLITKVWLAARTSSSYFCLIGSILYLTFGPWFVDEMLEDQLGAVFVWGIVFRGAFISGGHTYAYGIFQLLTFNIPLLFSLGHVLDMKRKHGTNLRGLRYLATFFPIALLFSFSVFMLREFPKAYSSRAFYFGPLRLGNVLILPLSIWMAFRADLKTPIHANGVH